jgi:hypothetical protein
MRILWRMLHQRLRLVGGDERAELMAGVRRHWLEGQCDVVTPSAGLMRDTALACAGLGATKQRKPLKSNRRPL